MSLVSGTPNSTSAGWSMSRPSVSWVVAAGALSLCGTGSNLAPADTVTPLLRTTSGIEASFAHSAEAAIFELRRLTGLTWEQLGDLFDVSRRTMHFWASGKEMNAANEERLHRVLALVRMTDRGTAAENRAALLQPAASGVRPFDLLASSQFSEALIGMGIGLGRAPATGSVSLRTSPEPLEANPKASSLMGARYDGEHKELGRSRAARIGKARKA